MANSNGGTILVGIENDGRVTGLNHQRRDLDLIPVCINNRTHLPILVQTQLRTNEERRVMVIEVSKSGPIVSTSRGKIQRRRIEPTVLLSVFGYWFTKSRRDSRKWGSLT